jgi:hypothetical protein
LDRTGHHHEVWWRCGEYKEGIFAETRKFPKISVHIWAAISISFKLPLEIFEENMSSVVYLKAVLKSGFMSLAKTTLGERHQHLAQNAVRCRTSAQSLDALFHVWNMFPKCAPNAPNLNQNEGLWAAIKPRLHSNQIQT